MRESAGATLAGEISFCPQRTATLDFGHDQDLPRPARPLPRTDKTREMHKAAVRDAYKTEGKDRDLETGEGGTLRLDKPKDIRRDD
ncbi:hypothetical protein [Bradyrhizobium sp.]|uniref:hypothetical protein n=1 Tax=Bradyrhizobium sp. TaxID=376 RepID=UPI0023848191|nr:hypothetical protein [Bradyrhizobium sp.]MDE1936927.1 hypothetical protein [Bradyrhizobium sp.]